MVPEGWEKARFEEVTRIANGQVDPKVEPYSSMLHIGPENVTSHSGQLSGCKTGKELGLISGKYEFDEQAIVYSKIRPNLNKVCRPKFHGLCSADMYPIWANQGLDIDYLYHYMLSPGFFKTAIAMSMRTGMPKINRSDLNAVRIVLPPLPEQKKIAQILSTWDQAITATERLLENSQQRKKGLMQQLLTGKKRLPGFEGEWEYVRLKELLTEEKTRNKDLSISRVLSVTNHSGFVLPEDQFSKRVASDNVSNYRVVRKGQYGYNPSRLNVGSFARLDRYDEGLLSPMYVVFSVDETRLNNDYFLNWMKSNEAKQRIAGSTQGSVRDSVGFDALCSFPFRLPPIDEQQEIAKVLTISDQEIDSLKQRISCLQQEKKALMQQLLTGKRRVQVEAA